MFIRVGTFIRINAVPPALISMPKFYANSVIYRTCEVLPKTG